MSARKMTPSTARMIAGWIEDLGREPYEELHRAYANKVAILLSAGASADDVAGAQALTAAYEQLLLGAHARWLAEQRAAASADHATEAC